LVPHECPGPEQQLPSGVWCFLSCQQRIPVQQQEQQAALC
jgi:hypothetical protein